MAEKQKISVNISRGMREDVDPFTLEPPHTEYLENARLDKDACIAKRRGDIQLGELGTLEGSPKIFKAQGNTLVTVSNESVHRYSSDSAAWTNTDLTHPLYGSEKKLSTAAKRGAGLFSFVKTPSGYVVAYEVRRSGETSGDSDVRCYIEGYGANGELLWTDNFFGINPQVRQTYSGGNLRDEVIISYAAYQMPTFGVGGTANFPPGVLSSKIYNSETGATVGSTQTHATDLSLYNPYCLEHFFRNFLVFVVEGDPVLKIGHTVNSWQSAQYKMHMNDSQEKGVIAYIEATPQHNTAHTGQIIEIDRDGVATGTTWTFDTGTTLHSSILDVKLDDSGWAHVLWTTREDSTGLTGQTRLYYAVKDLSGATTHTETIYSTGDYMVTQGAIGVKNIFYPAYLSYRVDLGSVASPSKTYITTPGYDTSYTEIRRITDWTSGITLDTALKVTGQGLASEIEISPNNVTDAKVYQCFEQYNDFTPFVGSGVSGLQGEADTPASVKQVTTVLCEIQNNQDQPIIPIGTFDAGTSKHLDAARSMNCNHLASLYKDVDDDSFFYVNRNLLAPEDYSKEAFGEYAISGAPSELGHYGFSLALGNAQGNVYRVSDDYSFSSTEFGDGLVVNSSLPLWIDEGSVTEAAILDQPEITYLASSDADKPLAWTYNVTLGSNWWTFQAIIGYTDHSGNVHRSSPSEVLYVDGVDRADAESSVNDGTLTVKVTPPLALDPNKPYFVEVYSAPSGENPRLATQKTFLPKDVYADGIEVSWQHIMYRQVATSNIVRSTKDVYTTGGEFAADPWAPFGASVVTSRRMFALSTSLVGTVFYTKLFQENVAPEFSASNVLSLGDARKLKAIGTIDDKVLVFEKDAVHVIFGDGPSNTGRGAPFSVQRLQTDIGCEDQESVVEIPQGLMFYSSVSSEFHLIDREMQVHNIGAAVRGMSESIDIKSATVVPEEREVRFLVTDTSSGEAFGPEPSGSIGSLSRPPRPRFRHVLPADPVMVYNYERDAWWVDSNMRGELSTLFENKYTRIDSTFDVFQESSTSWQSQTGNNLMKATTPWFKFDGLQGYARVRRAWVLGRYMSDFSDSGGIQAGDLQVTSRYNNEGPGGSSTTKRYRANVELQPDAERFQLRFTPGRQKVQSIQFSLEEIESELVNVDDPAFSVGRGFEITGIDLEVVLRGGGVKTLSSRRKK